MSAIATHTKPSRIVSGTLIPTSFYSRLVRDILRFGDNIGIQLIDETGRHHSWSGEAILEAESHLEGGRFEELEFHYGYSGELWCDRFSFRSLQVEFTRVRE